MSEAWRRVRAGRVDDLRLGRPTRLEVDGDGGEVWVEVPAGG